jgi:hypothetical protein
MIDVIKQLPPIQFDGLTIDVLCRKDDFYFIGYARLDDDGYVMDWTDAANGNEVLGVTHWSYLSVLQVYNEGQGFFTIAVEKPYGGV